MAFDSRPANVRKVTASEVDMSQLLVFAVLTTTYDGRAGRAYVGGRIQ